MAGGPLHFTPSDFYKYTPAHSIFPSFDPITHFKKRPAVQSRHFSLWILRAFRLQSVPAALLQLHDTTQLTIQTPVLMVLIMIWIGDDGKIILQSFVYSLIYSMTWYTNLISH